MSWTGAVNSQILSPHFNVYGDSLSALGSSNWVSVGMAAGFASGKLINQNATGGIDSAAILVKMQNDAAIAGKPFYTRKTYIWAGENDQQAVGWDGTNTLANIASMVALCQPGRFRILEILPKSLDSNYFTGGSKRVISDSVNNQLATLYGKAFIRLIPALQAGGNGGTQDNADIANGVIPTSIRQPADTIHMVLMSSIGDGTGNGIVYTTVAAAG